MDPEPFLERWSVEIGDARLDAVVEGTGPVTVIFENGLATALEAWDAGGPQLGWGRGAHVRPLLPG